MVSDENVQMRPFGRILATDIAIGKSSRTHIYDLTHFVRVRAKAHERTSRDLEPLVLPMLVEPFSRASIGPGLISFVSPDTFVPSVFNHLFPKRHKEHLLWKQLNWSLVYW
jgi:hypothetical protein